ncbi:signal peptidase I [Peptoniphilus senegalensis]|uniref:signal peptidase I n=1 Tax=Peptoniphilus senegalensis TaxID=1465757 RepID=UPI000315C650|nr:signal peptidase I [Peptoniphilus senegalensis]
MKKDLSYIKIIVIAIILALIIRTFLFNIVRVQQTSMYPTLKPNDIILSSSLYRFKKDFRRGDIVVFKSTSENKMLIKRIVGLPGEKVEIYDGSIYIDGELLEEKYFKEKPYTLSPTREFKVQEDELFVLGDNRNPGASVDSRLFGPIKIKSIRSHPFYRLFPLNSKKLINEIN